MNQEHKIGFVSLGCPKATVDSERIITQLRAQDYQIVPNYDDADLVVVNTCGFIDSAVEESLQAIGEALSENGKVIVTGCLGVKKELLQQKYPSLLAVTGPQATEEVLSAIHKELPPAHDPYMDLVPPGGMKLTPRHYAYLKISEGCNHKCSFCIIPTMRGRLVSRSIVDVVNEAKALVSAGVKEILVVSQDTSAYGVDRKYQTEFNGTTPLKNDLYTLAKTLGSLGVWVRLHYVYPYPSVDKIIPLMAQGLLLPYLDIPFQHANPRILKDMRRPANQENTLERIRSWREICPDITIRSTFIVGFPGETEEDFQELLDFLDEAQLDRVGCFEYSPVDGASANELANHVPEDVKKQRWERFMQKQSEISEAKLAAKIGRKIEVLVDEKHPNRLIARSHADAPEIDGLVFIDSELHDQALHNNVSVGDKIVVEVVASDEHDLYARLLDDD